MKTAIYIEDGVTQLVLTPETEWETKIIGEAQLGDAIARIRRGEFFANRAGYFRQGNGTESLIFRIVPNGPCSTIQTPTATVQVFPWGGGPEGLGDLLRLAAEQADAVAANPGMLRPIGGDQP